MGKKKRNKKKGESSSQIPSPRLSCSPANNNDAAVASSSGRGSRVTESQATNPYTVGQAIMRENFFSCCRQFYTLPELIEFMTTKHRRLTAETVTKAYKQMLQSRNAETYLLLAQYHSTVRQSERKRLETEDSVSTTPQSDDASSSST